MPLSSSLFEMRNKELAVAERCVGEGGFGGTLVPRAFIYRKDLSLNNIYSMTSKIDHMLNCMKKCGIDLTNQPLIDKIKENNRSKIEGKYTKKHVQLGEYFPHNQIMHCRLELCATTSQYFGDITMILSQQTYQNLAKIKWEINGVYFDILYFDEGKCDYLWDLHGMSSKPKIGEDGRLMVQLPLLVGVFPIDNRYNHELIMYFEKPETESVELWTDLYTIPDKLYPIKQLTHFDGAETIIIPDSRCIKMRMIAVMQSRLVSELFFNFGSRHNEYIKYLKHAQIYINGVEFFEGESSVIKYFPNYCTVAIGTPKMQYDLTQVDNCVLHLIFTEDCPIGEPIDCYVMCHDYCDISRYI